MRWKGPATVPGKSELNAMPGRPGTFEIAVDKKSMYQTQDALQIDRVPDVNDDTLGDRGTRGTALIIEADQSGPAGEGATYVGT